MKVAQERRRWLLAALGYTLSGTLSAALTGLALGALGRLALGPPPAHAAVAWGLAGLALLLAAREWRLVSFPLPRPLRQTEKVWAHEFGLVGASLMWGFHIGLGFVTQVRHGGFWLVAAAGFFFADARYAALLQVAYWFGRALSLWIAPLVLPDGGGDPELMVDLVRFDADAQRQFQAVALVMSALALVGLALAGRPETLALARLVSRP